MKRALHNVDTGAVEQSRWKAAMLAGQPERYAEQLREQHDNDRKKYGQREANLKLKEKIRRYRGRIPNNASDALLRAFADEYAGRVQRALAYSENRTADLMERYSIAHNVASGAGVDPPRPDDPESGQALQACIERLCCKYWWRRRIRVAFGRRVEQTARAIGLVGKNADLYISAEGFERWQERQAENRRTLETATAEADDGTAMTLADVAAAGVSNPRVRRQELMARISGTEQLADRRGDRALFITWTAPPEYHAETGPGKPTTGQHVTPREAQAWLANQWAKARAALKRRQIDVYGLRVAEPHRDGTPHWHMLLFVPESQRETLEAILTRYVIAGDTRVIRQCYGYRHTLIDRSKGTAAGYVAKYVAKAVDGTGIDAAKVDHGSGGGRETVQVEPTEVAQRVRAWSSQWGIRQFQFIGLPSIGVWRELRRLDQFTVHQRAKSQALHKTELLRAAADNGDWQSYVRQMGGPCLEDNKRPVVARYLAVDTGRYGEPTYTQYLEAYGRTVWTRLKRWTIRYDGKEKHEGVNRSAAGRMARRENRDAVGLDRTKRNHQPTKTPSKRITLWQVKKPKKNRNPSASRTPSRKSHARTPTAIDST